MRRTEAPPAGWYPDPSGGVRLRWWDGADWTNRYRARPAIGTAPRADATGRSRVPAPPSLQQAADAAGRLAAAVDTDALVAQVRQATRAELDRAADVLTARARAATSDLHPLISQYSNRAVRWLRIALALVTALVVVWVVLQIAAHTALFDWIGDRLDALGDTGDT